MSLDDPTPFELQLADQIDAVLRADQQSFLNVVGGDFLAQTMERVRAEPIAYSVGVPGDFEFANCGRGVLPIREGGYSVSALRTAAVRDAEARGDTRAAFADQINDYWEAVRVATDGGSPVKTVILRRGDGRLEYVVPPVFWSPRRAAELACHQTAIEHCAFCEREFSIRLDTFLLNECGGVLYVLAACNACEQTVEDEAGFGLAQWLRTWDDWPLVTGWPDDSAR